MGGAEDFVTGFHLGVSSEGTRREDRKQERREGSQPKFTSPAPLDLSCLCVFLGTVEATSHGKIKPRLGSTGPWNDGRTLLPS